MATMTLEEIMAIPDEEIRKEEESVKKIPCEHDPDCPKRTMEQLKAMGWLGVIPEKKRRENSRPIRTAYFSFYQTKFLFLEFAYGILYFFLCKSFKSR